MFGIGAGEFVIILIVGLIVFGPSKLPEVGRALGKLLREFRKAQTALSDTLNEVEEPIKKVDEKTSPVEKVSVEKTSSAEKVSVEKTSPAEKVSVEKTSPAEKVSVEKTSPVEAVDQKKSPTVTADDVINFAKENSFVKENRDEKISNGNPHDLPAVDARASLAGSGSGSNGVDK